MITLKEKKQTVSDLEELFSKASGVYLVDFEYMTVEEANEFRGQIHENELDYKVAKNTLLRRALDGNEKFKFEEEDLKGHTGVIFGYEDPVTPAKLIKKAFEEYERPKLKAAIIEGKYYDSSKLKTLASLPTKEDVMAGIVGSINSPAQGIVGAISAVMRDLSYVIHEGVKKQEEAA